jgi:antitoxin FitA
MEVFRMPFNLSIKNAPDELVALLKLKAQRNHRSLQGELLAIIEEAVRTPKPLTVDGLLAKVRELGLKTPSESAQIIREMRDARSGG